MNKKVMGILKNGGLFVGLLALTFYMVFKDNSVGEVIDAVSHADHTYLLAGIGAMCLFQFCEGMNISRSLRLFGYDIGILQAVKYAIIGFFFSAVTPSASGGQPMQVYYMHKDKIDVSHGTLALLFELLSFETVTVTLAIIGFFYQGDVINESMGNLKYLLWIGVFLNAIVMILLVMAIFTKKTIATLALSVVKLIRLFSKDKAEHFHEMITSQVSEYQRSAKYFKENKTIFIKTLLTTLLQISAMYIIPFFIYKSFGLNEYTVFEAMALQAVLYVAVSALPLPGALGVSESGFMMLFKTLFPVQMLGSAMILSRGISFYLFVLISGIAIAIFTLRKKKENYGLYNIDCRR